MPSTRFRVGIREGFTDPIHPPVLCGRDRFYSVGVSIGRSCATITHRFAH